MKITIFISLLLLCSYQMILAQSDSIENNFLKEFDKFKQSIQIEHQQFRNQNDSVFAKFLKDSWEEFDVFYTEKPDMFQPLIQPEFKKDTLLSPTEILISPVDSAVNNTMEQGAIPEVLPLKPRESGGSSILNFDFYGEKTSAQHPGNLPVINRINSENIDYYFRNTAKLPAIIELVQELRLTQQKMHLNDWGFFKLVQKMSQKVEKQPSRQILFTWVVMLKSGYNVKAGYTMDETFLLLPASENVYLNQYLTINDVPYYIQSTRDANKPIPRIMVHTNKYPESRNLSFNMKEVPLLGEYDLERKIAFKSDTLKVFQNKTLINYYNDYPLCELSVYFSTPFSDNNLHQLQRFFLPMLEGKTEQQKVEILLEFVQSAFVYKTDSMQFGREKYMFADELLYFPFSDCEDRAVFFSRLIKSFTGLDCIGLNFPHHVSTALRFTGEMEGTFIKIDNNTYTICDPTFKDAPIGYLSPKHQKQKPMIVSLN